jgi:hypothetical protein
MNEGTMEFLSETAEKAAQISPDLETIIAEVVVNLCDTIDVATALIGPDLMGSILDAVLEEIDGESHDYYHQCHDYYRSVHEIHSTL